jgi:hypothetical protein
VLERSSCDNFEFKNRKSSLRLKFINSETSQTKADINV